MVARVLDIQIHSTKIVYHLEDIAGKMTAAFLHTQQDDMDDSVVHLFIYYENENENHMINSMYYSRNNRSCTCTVHLQYPQCAFVKTVLIKLWIKYIIFSVFAAH